MPIYEQITSQIKQLILNGELESGEALPLSAAAGEELRISVITTKRAYEELEAGGLCDKRSAEKAVLWSGGRAASFCRRKSCGWWRRSSLWR